MGAVNKDAEWTSARGAAGCPVCEACLEYQLDEYIDETGRAPDVERLVPDPQAGATDGAMACVRCGRTAGYRLV